MNGSIPALIGLLAIAVSVVALYRTRKSNERIEQLEDGQKTLGRTALRSHASYLLNLVSELDERLNDRVRTATIWSEEDIQRLFEYANAVGQDDESRKANRAVAALRVLAQCVADVRATSTGQGFRFDKYKLTDQWPSELGKARDLLFEILAETKEVGS